MGQYNKKQSFDERRDGSAVKYVKYFEIVVRISLESFAVVNETGKDDDTQHQEKNEQRQFFSRRFKRVNLFNQNLKKKKKKKTIQTNKRFEHKKWVVRES